MFPGRDSGSERVPRVNGTQAGWEPARPPPASCRSCLSRGLHPAPSSAAHACEASPTLPTLPLLGGRAPVARAALRLPPPLSPPVSRSQACFSILSLTPLWTFYLGFSSFCLFFSLKSFPLIGPLWLCSLGTRLLLRLLET